LPEARFVGIKHFCVGLSPGVGARESVLKYFHKCEFNPGVEKPSSQKLRVLQKIFQKIFQHFEITLFTQLTSYNYSTLFALYMLTLAAFKYLTEINSFTHRPPLPSH
jgi:hypothetical protein